MLLIVVGTVKSIGKIFLTDKKLETFLTEAENIFNSPSLAYVGKDFGSGFSLTPAHFFNLNANSEVAIIEIKMIQTMKRRTQLTNY